MKLTGLWAAWRAGRVRQGADMRSPRAVVRRLTLIYLVALALIAAIVVSAVRIRAVYIEPPLANDTRAVQLVTEQEEFSQRLGKDALAIVAAPDASAPFVADMHATLSSMEHDYAIMRGTGGMPGLRAQHTEDTAALFEILQPHYDALVRASTHFLALVDAGKATPVGSAALHDDVQTILSEAIPFEASVEQIAEHFQDDAEAILEREDELDAILIGLTVVALVLVALLVLRPAVRRTEESIEELVRTEELQREVAALKDQFIIDANHELRTPIMALYNNLELLELVERRNDPALRADLLQQALLSGDALLRLLSNVLDAGAIGEQAPSVTRAPVSLRSLVRTVLDTFDPREIGEPSLAPSAYQSRAVSMDIAEDLVVWADEVRVRQVLVNLISNALKYSEPGSAIEIWAARILASPQRGEGWGSLLQGNALAPHPELIRVGVRDHGLGVPPRDAPKLFNRFVRLPRDIAGPVRGTGIGLYLCRSYVEAMGGRIWVESSGVPGDGSLFSFTLPILESLAPAQGSAAPASAQHV